MTQPNPNPNPVPGSEIDPDLIPTAIPGSAQDLIANAPPIARMTKSEKRIAALQSLASLAALVDLVPDEIQIRRIAKAEADKIRPTRIRIETPTGIRDLGERIAHPAFAEIVKIAASGISILLVGPAGSGKTSLCEMIADALGLSFYFSGAVLKKHEMTGYRDATGAIVRTAFRDAFEKGGLFLFDEIDASNPQALLTINAALANGWADFPDGRVRANPDFRFIAAANTNGSGASREYSGRNQLDAATLDRFGVIIPIDYDPTLTDRICAAIAIPDALRPDAQIWIETVSDFRAAMGELGLRGVISPRAAITGVRLIGAGFKIPRLIEILILQRFASPDDRRRLDRKAKEVAAARSKDLPPPPATGS